MRLTASEIAKIINARLVGNSDIVIEGVASVEEAGDKDVTFISDSRYEKKISATRSPLIISSKDYGLKDKAFLLVDNPLAAFAALLEYLQKEKTARSKIFKKGIHPSAVISEMASLGKNITVGPCAVIEPGAAIGDESVISAGCYIGENARIGKSCVIHPNVAVLWGCVLGDNVIIHSASVIGSDGFGYIPGAGSVKKIPQIGIVRIGNDVEIGSNVSIARATIGETVIGDETKIDNLSHIAHNVRIGRRCLIAAGAGIAGSAVIGDGVIMGGQAGVRDHVVIGPRAIIAARAGVIGDVKSGETVSGFPARPHPRMMKLYALIEKLPEILERLKKLEKK